MAVPGELTKTADMTGNNKVGPQIMCEVSGNDADNPPRRKNFFQWKKEETERLPGQGDEIKFMYVRFGRGHVVGFWKRRRQGVP